MKVLGFSTLLAVLILISGCAPAAPASIPTSQLLPTETPIPTPLPTATAAVVGPLTPEKLFEFDNAPDPFKDPYGIAIDSSGNLYVNDAGNSRVLIFDAGPRWRGVRYLRSLSPSTVCASRHC